MEISIYKITSPSGKIYIGQTKDFDKRKWGEKNPTAKKIMRDDGKIYGCIADAARDLNVTPAAIGSVLKQRTQTCKKFIFQYL